MFKIAEIGSITYLLNMAKIAHGMSHKLHSSTNGKVSTAAKI
jgi:hypothetical protein